jgi:hypothetical protein
MSNADIGYSSTFGVEGGTPGTYVAVAEVTGITPPGYSRDKEDVTHLTSPDRFKEFIAGMNEMTDAALSLNWVPSETDAMTAVFLATSGNYEITAPNGVKIQFSGFCTKYEMGEITNGKMTASATFAVTGKPTWVAAS